MSRHDDRITLRQMLDHVEEAMTISQAKTRENIDSDRILFLALLKLVEIVGEAGTRVSETVQTAHPEIPWRQIIGTRHRLIHGYDSVDANILWDIVTNDFPALAAQISTLLADGQG